MSNFQKKKFKNVTINSIFTQVLRDILKEVQTSMVPRTIVREWASTTFQSATDYWTFRKVLTLQLSLAAFVEYVLHLTRLNPDILYLHQVN